MAHTPRLTQSVSDYFTVVTGPSAPPTFEGLALAAGFNSFAQMRKAITDTESSYPQESKDALIIGCAHIADVYQQNGLLETLNPAFIKYLLSAYLNISERSVSEAHSTEDKTITIRWATPEEFTPSPLEQQAQRQKIAATATSKTLLADELAELEQAHNEADLAEIL